MTQGFNWLDWALVVLLFLSVTGGLRKGLIRQAIDFAGLFVGLFFAWQFSPAVAHWLNVSFNLETGLRSVVLPLVGDLSLEPLLLSVVSFLLVWAVANIALNLLGSTLEAMARLPVLSSANRLGGALFGLLRGAIVLFIVASIVSIAPVTTSLGQAAANSYFVAQVSRVSPIFYEQLQRMIRDVNRPF